MVAAFVVAAAAVLTSPSNEADPTAALLQLSPTPSTVKASPRVILPQRTAQSVTGDDPIVTYSPAPTPTPAPTPSPEPPTPEPIRQPVGIDTETAPPPPAETAPPAPTPEPGGPRPDLAGQLLGLLNDQRTQRGLQPVSLNNSLSASSDYYAELIWNENPYNLDHWLDGGPGDRAWSRGYCCGVGEILVESEGSASEMVGLWMNSQAHRDIIVDPQYVSVGIACFSGPYVGEDGNTHHPIVCVGDFGSG
ncbi:MAG: CAP domain-containing protein [Chloroflexota bacterium]